MFNWDDFYSLALRLETEASNCGFPEAAHRSCVSRIYYSAFKKAFKLGIKTGFEPKFAGEDHSGLRCHFKAKGKTQLTQHLSDLQEWRELCDYSDASLENLSQLVAQAKRSALKVRDLVGNV